MPQDVRTILTGERATSNFHHWCLTPTNFTEMNMDRFFFEPAFLSKDVEDTEYIALLEVSTMTS